MLDALALANIELENCWVCGIKFTEFGGQPNTYKHSHHMVPRAYGGKDGPTVSLCDSHHTTIHQLALKLEAGKPVNNFLEGDNKTDRRLLWLASIIVNAKALTTNDPNKPMPIMFVANKDIKEKLKTLKTIYRQSYGTIIQHAIANLYNKHFR
jgi:hypothetical protein